MAEPRRFRTGATRVAAGIFCSLSNADGYSLQLLKGRATSTKYGVPSTEYRVRSTKHKAKIAWYSVLGTPYSVLRTPYSALRTRYWVLCTRLFATRTAPPESPNQNPSAPMQFSLQTLMLVFVVVAASLSLCGPWGLLLAAVVLTCAGYIRVARDRGKAWVVVTFVSCICSCLGLAALAVTEPRTHLRSDSCGII